MVVDQNSFIPERPFFADGVTRRRERAETRWPERGAGMGRGIRRMKCEEISIIILLGYKNPRFSAVMIIESWKSRELNGNENPSGSSNLTDAV